MTPRRITYVASEKLAKVRLSSCPEFRSLDMIFQTCSLLPSNRNRSTFVHALVTSFGLIRPAPTPSSASCIVSLLRPSPASESDLTAYHDRSYVNTLLADPPGPDHVSCKEFGLEDVLHATQLTSPFRSAHEINVGLRPLLWPQGICPRDSRRINDCRTGACRRQV